MRAHMLLKGYQYPEHEHECAEGNVMSDLMLSRRHLLGVGASAAMLASQGSGQALAETAGLIPSRSGLAWASDDSQPTPVGYIISRDRYLKRDELGVIYQLCVAPGEQRG